LTQTTETLINMAFDFVSNFVGLFLEDRFKEIEDFGVQSSDIQSEQLFNLLREAEETEWGKKYDFKSIFSYQDFRERLPIQRASDLLPVLEEIKSGVSNILWPGLPKEILPAFGEEKVPISEQAIEEIFFQGINDSFAIYLHHYPQSKLFSGFTVSVGNGNYDFCMDRLHSLLRKNEPFISSLLNMPKRMTNEKDRIISTHHLLKEIKGEKISCFKGSPDSLLELFKKAGLNEKESNLKQLWPDVEVLFHGSPAPTSLIIEQRKLLPADLAYQATYSSPEGLFGIQDDPDDSAYLLMLDLSTFYEFIPVNGPSDLCIPLEDIDLKSDYQMVITNCSGLWRYCSGGPKLRFISKKPYRFILI
jgi:hypothetical protein